MQMNDQHYRQRALQELGVGPVWLLRQAVVTASVQVAGAADIVVADEPLQHDVMREAGSEQLARSTQGATADSPADVPAAMDEKAAVVLSVEPLIEVIAPEANPASQQVLPISALSWDALQPMVETCVSCGLCKGRKKAVFGTGDRQAKWLFVGEGPGYNENIQGLPFVGAAGQLLDNMLKALGMQRGDQTYIANIVKCRPTDGQGKDRPPTPDEVAACLPYLHRQIALIQPQVIVALGKTAAVSLLGLDMETPIGQLRGKVHQFQGIPMVATYHPAYLLRKPTEKSKAWIDLCLAQKALPVS